MKFDVAVIGLGYVGLSLAAAMNKAGLKVLGVELRDEIREKVYLGIAPFHEPGLAAAMAGLATCRALQPEDEADVYVICVGSPVHEPVAAIAAATADIAAHMRGGELVILRSTAPVGTTRDVIAPPLKGKTPHIVVAPERTVEGAALEEIRHVPQIVGGPVAARTIALMLLKRFAGAWAGPQLDSWEEAEAAKLLANVYRSVQFGLANEVAVMCDRWGVSASRVIEAANRDYPRCNIAKPGPAGGPCLTKDPWLFLHGAYTPGTRSIVAAAANLHEDLQRQLVDHIQAEWTRRPMPPDAKIAILGTAFKGTPPTDDIRHSPALWLAESLENRGWNVTTVDPLAPADLRPSEFCERSYDIVVVATDHADWRLMANVQRLNPGGFIYDTCGALSPDGVGVLGDGKRYLRFGG